MGSFDNCKDNLEESDLVSFLETGKKWSAKRGIGIRVFRHITEGEKFLDCDHLVPIILTLSNVDIDDFKALENSYLQECYNHCLCGGEVVLAVKPNIIGRSVNKKYFINHLCFEHRDIFNSYAAAEKFLDRIIYDERAKISTIEGSALMTKYSAWITWNENDFAGDPFHFMLNEKADEVRACLGIKTKRKGASPHLLLLKYKRPDFLCLYRPTIADAGLYENFEPSPVEGHGYTVPWPQDEIDTYLPGFDVRPLPEALHKPAQLSLLQIPIRCLK